MMRREMRARRRLGANSRSTDVVHVVVTPWADEYVPADLPPTLHVMPARRPTYLPTPALICQVGLPTRYSGKKKSKGWRALIASPHCHSLGDAARENEHARTLMAEALDQLELLNLLASPRASNAGRASRLLVSYESLMTLGDAYLRDLFSSLGLLGSWDGFVPPLHDGNAAFIRGAVNVGGRNALADESNETSPTIRRYIYNMKNIVSYVPPPKSSKRPSKSAARRRKLCVFSIRKLPRAIFMGFPSPTPLVFHAF